MHENLQITNGVYRIFSTIDIKNRIRQLGSSKNVLDEKDLIMLLENTDNKLRRN
jgi:hypothetical protein